MSDLAEAFTKPETVRVELVPLQDQTILFDGPCRLTFEGEAFVRD